MGIYRMKKYAEADDAYVEKTLKQLEIHGKILIFEPLYRYHPETGNFRRLLIVGEGPTFFGRRSQYSVGESNVL